MENLKFVVLNCASSAKGRALCADLPQAANRSFSGPVLAGFDLQWPILKIAVVEFEEHLPLTEY
jgi:hypothetical protein